MHIYIYIYIHTTLVIRSLFRCYLLFVLLCLFLLPVSSPFLGTRPKGTPSLPTKIIPAKIPWLKISGKSPMDMRIPPLKIKIMLDSNPLKSRILVRRLAVRTQGVQQRYFLPSVWAQGVFLSIAVRKLLFSYRLPQGSPKLISLAA